MNRKWLVYMSVAVLVFVLTAAALADDTVKLFVNGREIESDVSPQIINGRTMVPIRWAAEALGAEVEWDGINRVVTISSAVSDAVHVVELADKFGQVIKNVSLTAPEEMVKKSLQDNYGELVASALLNQWQKEPQNAPGRVSSSPWPERIDILQLEKLPDGVYLINGEIIEMTSSEMVSGGYSAKRPVTLMVEKLENQWLITEVKYETRHYPDSPLIYRTSQYGFEFTLPQSWQDYSIIMEQWEGMAIGTQDLAESGPLILIRHPQWTETNVRQDIPVMVFTAQQWLALQQGSFHIGAAPIGPKAMGHNNQYVFALPARYNYAFPAGYEEVEKILESVPLKPFEI